MPVRFLIILLCLSPVVLYAKQENTEEQDLELFEFLAMYSQKDEIFIDAEIDERTEKELTNHNATTSESNE